ncbi:MAG: VF530 family protein [Candidatus Gracilibacteria bacterium]|nr:VF530 family protein [Candidatus Gracilibacteria bacterium]
MEKVKKEPINRNDDVLHGVTLSMILDYLIEEYGFEELAKLFNINCFKNNPSKDSSLKFLRKTEWARLQVQGLYVKSILSKKKKTHF